MVTFKSATPTPFIKIYFGELHNLHRNIKHVHVHTIMCNDSVAADSKKVTLDVEGKEPDRILQEISAVAGKLE